MQPAVCHMTYNRAMSHLDILVPFGLPPAQLSADLLRELSLPALALLTSRASSEDISHTESSHDLARALPHETWLARRFGMAGDAQNSPPVAFALMRSFGLQPQAGTWFILQPVHIHIARDHLVLTDPRRLQLEEQEARALFDIARPLFEEVGKELLFGNASTWFVRAGDWNALQTSTPDAASGHNIDIWMPKGPGERDWRKVQNEVQMHWFNHAVNEEREMRRQKPVNSIWLWGGASVVEPVPAAYTHAFNLSGWMTAFGQLAQHRNPAATVSEIVGARFGHGLLALDALLEPALSNDWQQWLEQMRKLEADWFAPLLRALKAGAIDRISLVLTNDTNISRFTASKSSLRKFWVKATLAPLCP